jgi:type IV pilus assembly protein PilV
MIVSRRSSAAARRDRSGFTLVELMVAMMLLSVGMLALASSSAVVIKQMTEAGTMSVASSVAQTRMERLRTAASTCAAAAAVNGNATTRGVTESWTITPMTRSAQLSVTVTYDTKRGNRSQTYLSMVPCI